MKILSSVVVLLALSTSAFAAEKRCFNEAADAAEAQIRVELEKKNPAKKKIDVMIFGVKSTGGIGGGRIFDIEGAGFVGGYRQNGIQYSISGRLLINDDCQLIGTPNLQISVVGVLE